MNRKGQCNTPYGRPGTGDLCDYDNLKQVAEYFRDHVTIRLGDYRHTLSDAQSGDFVYLDPPYVPLSSTANFTSYTANGFNEDAQRELADYTKQLNAKNVQFMLSSPDVPLIRELYKPFKFHTVQVQRLVSCKAGTRGKVGELLVTNY